MFLKMKVKIEIPLCMGMMLNHHSHPYIHSTAVMCGILYHLPGLISHCDNIGLLSLILLGWELRVLYHCTICTRHPNLVSLNFYAIPLFHILTFCVNVLLVVLSQC